MYHGRRVIPAPVAGGIPTARLRVEGSRRLAEILDQDARLRLQPVLVHRHQVALHHLVKEVAVVSWSGPARMAGKWAIRCAEARALLPGQRVIGLGPRGWG